MRDLKEMKVPDPELWEAPDRLSEEEWRVEAGADRRRAPGADGIEGDDA